MDQYVQSRISLRIGRVSLRFGRNTHLVSAPRTARSASPSLYRLQRSLKLIGVCSPKLIGISVFEKAAKEG
jgi:hypothetical protein